MLKTLPVTSYAADSQSATMPPVSDDWQEVAPKQKASITRSSGADVVSPVTKIFSAKLRSELRVPGLKNSVTLEPYQALQLDIGASNVNNITDALKGLTRSETLQGDFNSPRGPGVSATKQVFIDTLPAVLILHLKRFQYDNNTGGTQKIWKKVGYPLELEIPKEVFPPHKRNTVTLNNHGQLPRYRLIGVVYHHGKTASTGHYTVDVRRQDGQNWIRMDDTIIRRVRSDDVAEAGGPSEEISPEDARAIARALEQHDGTDAKATNPYDAITHSDADASNLNGVDEGGWSQATGDKPNGTKKWAAAAAAAVNGSPSGSGKRTPTASAASAAKDNKVAYILFYQEIRN